VVTAGGNVDLILMDIDLGGGLDGTEAAREILKHRDLPIVFLSSHTEADFLRKADEITSYGYVVKTSGFAVLDGWIRMALRLFGAKRRIEQERLHLEEVEDQFLRAMESIPDGLWDLDFVTGRKFCNPAFYRLFGLDPEESTVHEFNAFEFIHPEDVERVREDYEACCAGKRASAALEFRIPTKDGLQKWIACRVRAIDRSGGRGARRLIGVLVDITERKNSELKYRTLFESNVDGLVEVDAEGHIVDCNQAFEQLSGYSAPELRSRKIGELTAGPGQWEVGENPDAAFWPSGEADVAETMLTRKNGIPVHVERRIIRLHADDLEREGTWFIVRDISARKASEGQLNRSREYYFGLMNALGDGIVQFDGDSKVAYANPAAERLLGLPRGALVGRRIIEFFNAEGKEFFKSNAALRVKPGESATMLLHGLRSDGELRLFSCNVSPLYNSLDEWIGDSAVFRDVTEQARAESNLRDAAERERTLQKELEHRVKNSLSIIGSLMALATQSVKDDTSRKLLEDTQSRIMSMSAIYEQLYLGGNVDTIDFGAYVQRLGKSIFETFAVRSTEVALHTELDAIELETARAIPLGLIMNELLTNALKYAFAGRTKGTIWILLKSTPDAVSMTVSDDGIGMDPHVLETASSMGAIVVRQLAKQIGGILSVQSTQGTAVTIRLTK